MSASSSGRILKRTLTGAALVASVAAVLLATDRSPGGMPLRICAAAVLIAAVFETSRMGSLALTSLLPALLVAAAGVLALGFAEPGRVAPGTTGDPSLAFAYAWAGILAAAAFALGRGLRRLRVLGDSTTRLITYLVMGWIVLRAVPAGCVLPVETWIALGIVLVATVPLA